VSLIPRTLDIAYSTTGLRKGCSGRSRETYLPGKASELGSLEGESMFG
jgi:hypothetical protein